MSALFVNNDNGHADRATESYLNSAELVYILSW